MKRLQTITVKDILKVIEKRKTVGGKKIRWKFVDHRAIRAVIGKKWFCPITFYWYILTKEVKDSEDGFEIHILAIKHGMDSQKYGSILRASDGNTYNRYDKVLRRKLLKATELLEQARKNVEKI